jgi:hypothetical protein
MKKLLSLTLATVCVACTSSDKNERYVSDASANISRCVERYFDFAQSGIPLDVEKVYVFASQQQVDIVFASGEIGIFGPRSDSYRPIFGCGTRTDGSLGIYMVWDSGKGRPVFRGDENPPSPTEYLWDILFLRTGPEHFEFSEARRHSDEMFEDTSGGNPP